MNSKGISTGTSALSGKVQVNRLPVDNEGLTEDSVVIDTRGRRPLDINAIPFNPILYDVEDNWNTALIPQEPIQKLKKLINDGYDIYVYKIPTRQIETKYYEYLKLNHGLILQDYSKSFCKMILVEKEDISDKADDFCYTGKEIITLEGLRKG